MEGQPPLLAKVKNYLGREGPFNKGGGVVKDFKVCGSCRKDRDDP